MRMNLAGVVEHLIDVGLYDQPPILDTKEETPPLPTGQDTEEKESIGGNELVDGVKELGEEPV